MKRRELRAVWGTLLILGGIFFLLQNFGVFDFSGALWSVVWMAAFGLGGFGFLATLAMNRENWWAAIPGFALLGLAGTIGIDLLLPGTSLGGTIFLGCLGLGFVVVYLFRPDNWWAVIPGGVLLTLALVAFADDVGGIDSGSILFLGMGITFAVLAFLPAPQGRLTWALIPAGVMLVMGLVLALSVESLLAYLWPAVLILGGLFLIYRSYFRATNDR